MLSRRDRFDAWRETFALQMIRVDVTTSDRASFRAAMSFLPLDRVTLMRCDVNRVALLRTRDLVRDGNDDLSLVLCTAGRIEARFEAGAAAITPGEAALVPHHLVGAISCDEPATSISLRLPRALLRELLGPSCAPTLRVIPRDDPALQLLNLYADGIVRNGAVLHGTAAALAGRQLSELIAHLLGPTSDVARAQQFGGLKAARLEAIMAGIERHLVDPGLSAAWLGAKLSLSERYVHHLMAEAGLGFGRVVRQNGSSLPGRCCRRRARTGGGSSTSHMRPASTTCRTSIAPSASISAGRPRRCGAALEGARLLKSRQRAPG